MSQILKLIFEHDIRLEELAAKGEPLSEHASLEAFLRPDPTFSKFYFTATNIQTNEFGLSILDSFSKFCSELQHALSIPNFTDGIADFEHLSAALQTVEIGGAIVSGASKETTPTPVLSLGMNKTEGVIQKKPELKRFLEKGLLVFYKEKAHHGFDVHLFSKKNLFPVLFPVLKKFLGSGIRVFSMNGKKIRSERLFYFETWALNKPPHGIEEVFKESVL